MDFSNYRKPGEKELEHQLTPAQFTVTQREGTEPAFRCAEIRRRGPAARPAREYPLPCAIHMVMNQADEAWRQELRSVSLADLMTRVMNGASPKSLELGARWMQEVAR